MKINQITSCSGSGLLYARPVTKRSSQLWSSTWRKNIVWRLTSVICAILPPGPSFCLTSTRRKLTRSEMCFKHSNILIIDVQHFKYSCCTIIFHALIPVAPFYFRTSSMMLINIYICLSKNNSSWTKYIVKLMFLWYCKCLHSNWWISYVLQNGFTRKAHSLMVFTRALHPPTEVTRKSSGWRGCLHYKVFFSFFMSSAQSWFKALSILSYPPWQNQQILTNSSCFPCSKVSTYSSSTCIVQVPAWRVRVHQGSVYSLEHFPSLQGCLPWVRYEEVRRVVLQASIYIYRARLESTSVAQLHKQKLPSSVTEEDVLSFDMEQEYREVKSIAPLLTYTVAGSLNLKVADLQVIPVNDKYKLLWHYESWE